MPTMYSYSFSDKVRDLTPILRIMQEKAPGAFALFSIEGTCKSKHEWYDATDAPIETTLASAATAGTNTISVASASGMVAGDVLGFDDSTYERVTIASISGTTITLTGNLANNHSSGIRVLMISHPIVEGSSANPEDYDQATLLYNYTEIFRKDAKLARSIIGKVLEENRDNIIDAVVKQKTVELWRQLNNAVIWGTRRESTGQTSTTCGKLGGLMYWLYDDTNAIKSSCSGSALTETMVNDFLRTIRSKGGDPDTILCNVQTAQKFGSFNTATSNAQVVIEQKTDVAGVQMPTSVFMGSIPGMKIKRLYIDEAMPDTMLFALEKSKLKLIPHENDGAIHDYDTTPSDFDGVQRTIIGEYTVEIQNPYNSHGCLYNFTN